MKFFCYILYYATPSDEEKNIYQLLYNDYLEFSEKTDIEEEYTNLRISTVITLNHFIDPADNGKIVIYLITHNYLRNQLTEPSELFCTISISDIRAINKTKKITGYWYFQYRIKAKTNNVALDTRIVPQKNAELEILNFRIKVGNLTSARDVSLALIDKHTRTIVDLASGTLDNEFLQLNLSTDSSGGNHGLANQKLILKEPLRLYINTDNTFQTGETLQISLFAIVRNSYNPITLNYDTGDVMEDITWNSSYGWNHLI